MHYLVTILILNYTQAFDELWINFDQYYVFFSYKNFDWKSSYTDYYPKIKNIDSYDKGIDRVLDYALEFVNNLNSGQTKRN